VLGLSSDRRAVAYEVLEGNVEPVEALSTAERTGLEGAFAALPEGRATHVVRTPAGPVLWVAPLPDMSA
jgi:hypothetical protein